MQERLAECAGFTKELVEGRMFRDEMNREVNMKNETFKGSVFQGVCAILGTILAVILGGSGLAYYISTRNIDTTIYNSSGENIVNGDVHIDNSTDVSYTINGQIQSTDEVVDLAYTACLEGDYDKAYVLYKNSDEQIALLNLGYILAHGLSYVGEDVQKAEEYYHKADCIEAERNLFIFYLDNGMKEEAQEKCKELLWTLSDDVTWDYITNCIYQKSWNDYQEETGNTKDDFTFDFNDLYEWKYIDNYYQGYNPPSDTSRIRWIFQGMDTESGNKMNHSYCIYREQIRVFSVGVDKMENMYYELGGELYPMD